MSEYDIDKFGTKRWYNNKNYQLHREDESAVEYANGDKFWIYNGNYHREDGPAIEHPNGSKEWWINDLRHREAGPAIEWYDGEKWWYLNGIKYTKEEFILLQFSRGIIINE